MATQKEADCLRESYEVGTGMNQSPKEQMKKARKRWDTSAKKDKFFKHL
jgi:hypothetical protein